MIHFGPNSHCIIYGVSKTLGQNPELKWCIVIKRKTLFNETTCELSAISVFSNQV